MNFARQITTSLAMAVASLGVARADAPVVFGFEELSVP